MLGTSDASIVDLLPWHVGHHQNHQVEFEGVTYVDGSNEVADVRRIKGATKESDPERHGWLGHDCRA